MPYALKSLQINDICVSGHIRRSAEVEVMPWSGSAINMGFAFNRTTWNNIRRCAEYFCFKNDNNWDVSLESLSQKCSQGELLVMIVKEPRVFHLGRCASVKE
uniref:Uncharacterized protein n=1 Tax=Glossina austeni TaxID=7395 RepID=A0A1A9VM63_GLOAU